MPGAENERLSTWTVCLSQAPRSGQLAARVWAPAAWTPSRADCGEGSRLDPSQGASAGKLEGRCCPSSGLTRPHTDTDPFLGAEKPCARESRVCRVSPPTGPGAEGGHAASLLLRSCRWPGAGSSRAVHLCNTPWLVSCCLPLQAQFQLSQRDRRKPARKFLTPFLFKSSR